MRGPLNRGPRKNPMGISLLATPEAGAEAGTAAGAELGPSPLPEELGQEQQIHEYKQLES